MTKSALLAPRTCHPNLPHFGPLTFFVSELENLLSHFSIADSFDLLGHSWGSILAAEFIIRRQPKGLKHVVLANALASAKLRNEARVKLRKELPEDVQEVIRRHEEAGTTKEAEYKQAMLRFYERHLCRLQPFPEEVLYSFKQSELDDTVLKNMYASISLLPSSPVSPHPVDLCRIKGPDFGHVVCRQKNGLEDKWDITDKIHLIRVPTLLLNGEHDFETDEVCAPFFWGIDKIKWVKFAKSSHMPHWEERERYIEVVGSFLRDV
ncbi:hypothetical protein EW146_g7119 [Bondarzewia mesenterica]|uniref:AB hydrolase-1 domain-containing protein n=1 Tax=Bondarzewia mesenterica TaxID=1095465 RepID=A0A4V3XEB8_9AGAM|nr:hypothetical protein EW146_g7119 [Bondarzewia mesenterica]